MSLGSATPLWYQELGQAIMLLVTLGLVIWFVVRPISESVLWWFR